MANVYGSRNKNQFKLPSVESEETYYTLVNSETGEITLKRINKLVLDSPIGGLAEGQDATVGTIPSTGPNKGKFIPAAGATPTENKAFAQQSQTVKTVKDNAITTSNNAQKDLGVDQVTREKRTNQLFNNGQVSTSTTGEEIGGEVEPESFDQDSLNKQITDRKGGVRQNYGNMRYPRDAKFMSEQDCIKFTMFRYQPKKVAITSGLGAFSGSNKGKSMGTVMLPIQPTISDSNGVSWGENSMNALEAAAGAAALAGIMQGPEGMGKSIEDIAKGIRENKNDAIAGLAAGFASQAAGGNQGFLTRATGAILNNNLELLFQGPALRSFTFTFSMSARYKEESEEIRKIIRFFKQGMSVKRSEGDLFLKSPNIFDIQYYNKNKEHRYINKIKTCALQNCVVNYTPAGNYATYEDGAMTQYDITLSFGEIEPLFDDDYGQSDDGLIGY
jgi:hypothetical protein